MLSFLYPPATGRASTGLLILRIVAGSALIQHGLPKIMNAFHWSDAFIPAPGILQACAAVGEFGGGIALVLGLLTPLAALGIMINMIAALVKVHMPHGDPFVAQGKPSMELALLYFSLAFLFLMTGPGAVSLDRLLFGQRRRY